MNSKKFSRIVATLIAVIMLVCAIPMTVFASNWSETNVVYDGTTFGTNGYYNVISKKDYVLVPGAATETEMVLNNSTGTRRQVLHIIELDPSNPDVSVLPGYYNIDKLENDPSDVSAWAAAGVTDVAKYYDTTLGYNVVGAMNTDLDYTDNAPRILVYNGKILSGYAGASAPKSVLYVWNKDGKISCEVTDYSKANMEAGVADGTLIHAIGVSFAMTVKDGELVSKTEERTSSSAARSMVGVKPDGTLVLVMNDGRGANNSVGFNNYELGESMLALGCQWAANCDGGGSSSFVTRRAGEEDLVCRAVPCDGAERPTKASVIVVSNVAPTGELDTVNITSDYSVFAPSTTYTFGAQAIDTHGYAMDMPADAVWNLSDATFGTIDNGVFVSNGKTGEVVVQVISDAKVVGEKTISIANPEVLIFANSSTVVPYSTAEKTRKITLPLIATLGEENVYLDASVFEITSSEETAGTLDGFTFVATTDENVKGTVITAKYLPLGTTLTYEISFGKGSKVLFDFEDGTTNNFVGDDLVHEELDKLGVARDRHMYNMIDGGQYSFSCLSRTFVASRENGGKVHGGNYALGVDYDFRNVEFNSWVYGYFYSMNVENRMLRDVANGDAALNIGMWVYIPEGFCNPAGDTAGAVPLQFTYTMTKADGKTYNGYVFLSFYSENQKKTVSLSQCTEADIPENRWVYVTGAIDQNSLTAEFKDPRLEYGYTPMFIRMYIKPSRAQIMTFYYDDITLDYSTAVDDRNAPVITNPTYCTADTNIEFNNQTITTNKLSFNANIADYAASNAEGLDYTTAAIYVDGIKVSGTHAAGNSMGVENVVLSNGLHAITFEIADNIGNYTTLTKQITVNCDTAASEVYLAGHNDLNNVPESGSVYYVDVVAKDIAKINSITTELRLQTANKWELDNMIAADGFKAEYTYNDISKIATVTVTKTGNTTLAGEQTLVSIPVRVWEFDVNTNVGGDGAEAAYMTKAERFNKYGEPKVFIDVRTLSGAITYTDDTTGSFSSSISVATKLTGNKVNGPWHEHTINALPDKAATATENGYTGRTYCEVCGSVVDWGETLEAQGHHYVIADGKFVCSDDGCGKIFESGTGLFELNGKKYYSINGMLQTGWQTVDGGYCYADTETFEVTTGSKTVKGVTYTFDENGILAHGEWVKSEKGTRYSYGPAYYKRMWVKIDGKEYYFGTDSYMYTGIRFVKDSPATPGIWYDFGDDGSVDTTMHPADGLYELNGDFYIVKNGETQKGLAYIDGYYYYGGVGSGFDRFWCVAKDQTMSVEANDLISSGVYHFGADGKMEIYNGAVNGRIYKNGQQVHAYRLVEVDGSYYYIAEYHKYVTDKKVYLTQDVLAGTDFMPGYYEFGADGKMVIKNGADADGYFYLNGVKQKAYQLVEFEGGYYYIAEYHKYVTDKKVYLAQDILAGTDFVSGYYEFGADGKMVIKNGADADGYFYLNGVKQKAYQLIEFEGDYYYIAEYHKYVTDKKVYLAQDILAGTDFASGYYEFGADGKMLINN